MERGPDCSAKQRAVRAPSGEARTGSAGGHLRRDGDVASALHGAAQVVRSGLLLSVPRPYQSRAAKLHRAFRGRQGRALGADAEPRTGRQAGGGDLGHPREGRHGQHDAGRRRLRTAPVQRFHGRGRLDREARRRAGEAALEPRGRYSARFLSPRRVPFLQGRPRRRGRPRRIQRSFRDVRAGTASPRTQPRWTPTNFRRSSCRISNTASR